MKRAVSFRLEPELLERVLARSGELGQTQTKFVERALEAALESGPATYASRGETGSAGELPAPPRARDEAPLPKIARRKF